MMAIVQTFAHLRFDLDRVFRRMSPATRPADQRLRPRPLSIAQLQAFAPGLLRRVIIRSVMVSGVGPLVYMLLLRGWAWNGMLSVARIFWDLPAMVEMSFMPPYHISLLMRSLAATFFLQLLWESSNATFGAFIAQAPLKRGQPLTDASPDPNGTLLNGLRAKKGVIKVCP